MPLHAANPLFRRDFEQSLALQLAPLAPRFSEVLAGTMPVERLTRTIVISCERLPKLLECDRQSLFNAAKCCANAPTPCSPTSASTA